MDDHRIMQELEMSMLFSDITYSTHVLKLELERLLQFNEIDIRV